MKLYFLFAFVLFTGLSVKAQDCAGFFLLQKNKQVELSHFDRKGKAEGRTLYSIKEVNSTGGKIKSSVEMEGFDKKGKTIGNSVVAMECEGNKLLMDMRMFLSGPNQEQFKDVDASVAGFYLVYPASLSVGQSLEDGSLTLNLKQQSSGINSNMQMDITDRKVAAKENITTPAGSWDCYKITMTQKIKMSIGGIGIPIKFECTEWYAPGFGMVKTESRYGYSQITAIK